jgi:hypothetical protein
MSGKSTGSESAIPETAWKTGKPLESRSKKLVTDGVAVSGEDYSPTLITSGNRSTGSESPPTSRRRQLALRPAVSSKAQHRCQAVLAACIEDLGRAIDNNADFFARNNALEQLKAKLTDLWEMRTEREAAFGEFANMIQAVFVQRRVEDFTQQQLVCICSVFEKLQQEPLFDDELVNAITVELLGGGIDVFREIE